MTESRMIRCKVQPGIFREEYIVSIQTIEGGTIKPFEFVTDARSVEVNGTPAAGRELDGRVRVWLVESFGDHLSILVPASSGSDPRVLSIPPQAAAA